MNCGKFYKIVDICEITGVDGFGEGKTLISIIQPYIRPDLINKLNEITMSENESPQKLFERIDGTVEESANPTTTNMLVAAADALLGVEALEDELTRRGQEPGWIICSLLESRISSSLSTGVSAS